MGKSGDTSVFLVIGTSVVGDLMRKRSVYISEMGSQFGCDRIGVAICRRTPGSCVSGIGIAIAHQMKVEVSTVSEAIRLRTAFRCSQLLDCELGGCRMEKAPCAMCMG